MILMILFLIGSEAPQIRRDTHGCMCAYRWQEKEDEFKRRVLNEQAARLQELEQRLAQEREATNSAEKALAELKRSATLANAVSQKALEKKSQEEKGLRAELESVKTQLARLVQGEKKKKGREKLSALEEEGLLKKREAENLGLIHQRLKALISISIYEDVPKFRSAVRELRSMCEAGDDFRAVFSKPLDGMEAERYAEYCAKQEYGESGKSSGGKNRQDLEICMRGIVLQKEEPIFYTMAAKIYFDQHKMQDGERILNTGLRAVPQDLVSYLFFIECCVSTL